MTARHALATLAREGMVERHHGSGTLVAPRGSPLLRIRRLIFTTKGRACMYVVGLYRSGRHTLIIRRFR
jgi:DNA-binding GntR family transcriptional regulator